MQTKTTLRLVLPQWQGGMNPNYVFDSELLSYIAPPNDKHETITINISKDFKKPLETKFGVDRYEQLMAQILETQTVLNEKNPDRIITLGGDCSISQAPFSYLSQKYGEKFGILWIDAHPDIATPKHSTHLHEMVLGNLIGQGSKEFSDIVLKPLPANRVMYAGLIEKDLREGLDSGVFENQIRFATPEELSEQSQPILDWIAQNQIETLAVHFDLDVLSPNDFRSIYPAEPYTRVEEFPAAVGELTLEKVVRILTDISKTTELVGLSIAEYLPWDAINLRNALSQISIFKE